MFAWLSAAARGTCSFGFRLFNWAWARSARSTCTRCWRNAAFSQNPQHEYPEVTVLPVIERELRAEARHAFTYWLRALAASVLLIIFAVMMIDARVKAASPGAK